MSSPLTAVIAEEIRHRGPIPFRRFMELALYHPQHGYYASGRAQVGRKGDFFTNVSVGPLFGKLLARQFAEIWGNLGEPSSFSIVEQGAHEGQFAADVLTALREHDPACFGAATYWIVEPSPALAERQRERLQGLRVLWCTELAELAPFTGVHFSNELLDAFPVHVVRWDGNAWIERHVDAVADGFVFVDLPLSTPELHTACARIPQPLPIGYTTEVNLAAEHWIAEVAARLERGYVLAIDYGYLRDEYYKIDRTEGTLSAYARHRRENDPLRAPGEIDLTAHAEFSSVMEAATAAGLTLSGFTDQHHIMVGLGADYFGENSDPKEVRAFQTLMHPTLMGLAFKVVGFQKGITAPLSGFRFARSQD